MGGGASFKSFPALPPRLQQPLARSPPPSVRAFFTMGSSAPHSGQRGFGLAENSCPREIVNNAPLLIRYYETAPPNVS